MFDQTIYYTIVDDVCFKHLKPQIVANGLDQAVIKLTTLICIILIILIGNSLVIGAVVKYKHLRSINCRLMTSLSVADLSLGILVLPLSIAYEVIGGWVFGPFVCKLWQTLDILLCTASIYSLTLISLDRCLALTKPLFYRTQITKYKTNMFIVGFWLAALGLCGLSVGMYERDQNFNQDYYNYTDNPGAEYIKSDQKTSVLTAQTKHRARCNGPNETGELEPFGEMRIISGFASHNINLSAGIFAAELCRRCSCSPLRNTRGFIIVSAIFSFCVPFAVITVSYCRVLRITRRALRTATANMYMRTSINSFFGPNSVGPSIAVSPQHSQISNRRDSVKEVENLGIRENSSASYRSCETTIMPNAHKTSIETLGVPKTVTPRRVLCPDPPPAQRARAGRSFSVAFATNTNLLQSDYRLPFPSHKPDCQTMKAIFRLGTRKTAGNKHQSSDMKRDKTSKKRNKKHNDSNYMGNKIYQDSSKYKNFKQNKPTNNCYTLLPRSERHCRSNSSKTRPRRLSIASTYMFTRISQKKRSSNPVICFRPPSDFNITSAHTSTANYSEPSGVSSQPTSSYCEPEQHLPQLNKSEAILNRVLTPPKVKVRKSHLQQHTIPNSLDTELTKKEKTLAVPITADSMECSSNKSRQDIRRNINPKHCLSLDLQTKNRNTILAPDLPDLIHPNDSDERQSVTNRGQYAKEGLLKQEDTTNGIGIHSSQNSSNGYDASFRNPQQFQVNVNNTFNTADFTVHSEITSAVRKSSYLRSQSVPFEPEPQAGSNNSRKINQNCANTLSAPVNIRCRLSNNGNTGCFSSYPHSPGMTSDCLQYTPQTEFLSNDHHSKNDLQRKLSVTNRRLQPKKLAPRKSCPITQSRSFLHPETARIANYGSIENNNVATEAVNPVEIVCSFKNNIVTDTSAPSVVNCVPPIIPTNIISITSNFEPNERFQSGNSPNIDSRNANFRRKLRATGSTSFNNSITSIPENPQEQNYQVITVVDNTTSNSRNICPPLKSIEQHKSVSSIFLNVQHQGVFQYSTEMTKRRRACLIRQFSTTDDLPSCQLDKTLTGSSSDYGEIKSQVISEAEYWKNNLSNTTAFGTKAKPNRIPHVVTQANRIFNKDRKTGSGSPPTPSIHSSSNSTSKQNISCNTETISSQSAERSGSSNTTVTTQKLELLPFTLTPKSASSTHQVSTSSASLDEYPNIEPTQRKPMEKEKMSQKLSLIMRRVSPVTNYLGRRSLEYCITGTGSTSQYRISAASKRERILSRRRSAICVSRQLSGSVVRKITMDQTKDPSLLEKHYLKKEEKLSRIIGRMIGCFLCCWIGFAALYLAHAFTACQPKRHIVTGIHNFTAGYIAPSKLTSGCSLSACFPEWLIGLAIWLGYSNSAINPFIYALGHPEFKKALLRCFNRQTNPYERNGNGQILSMLASRSNVPSQFRSMENSRNMR